MYVINNNEYGHLASLKGFGWVVELAGNTVSKVHVHGHWFCSLKSAISIISTVWWES